MRPDSIEVWNIGWAWRRDVMPLASTSNNHESLPYWEQDFLKDGPMPATGGSDNHWRSTTAAQGAGQPCTWVYAVDRSWRAILDGIAAGRTFIAAEPPGLGGAQVFLSVESGANRWMVGDTVPASEGTVTVAARILGAPGNLARFAIDGNYTTPQPVIGVDTTLSLEVTAANVSRVRVEVYLDEGYWMTALTSCIYFG